MEATVRLTTAQALVRFLRAQFVERDGTTARLIGGVFGIFGHGNLGGLGPALHEHRHDLPYYLGRNEQAMVHIASGYARARNRLGTLAVAASIGPGSANLVTGAATATVNRLPVLLLPADAPATRRPRPVLQQIEPPYSGAVSVNDSLRAVSRFWDRIERPEQLIWAVPQAMRVLTDPAETGAVTLALPTDVQSEAFDFPVSLFDERVWHVPRIRPDAEALERAAGLIRDASRPLIVAGGGVLYSEASTVLARFAEDTGIPVAETMSGKGSLPHAHPGNVGALGVNGSPSAARLAREADLVIGIGTRWTDVTSVSQTLFQHPEVRFVNVNVTALDAHKLSGASVVGDARATIEVLAPLLDGHRIDDTYRDEIDRLVAEWNDTSRTFTDPTPEPGAMLTQAEVVGAVNRAAGPDGVVVGASGSLPNDLHKLWQAGERPGSYHVEYGFSCMGYEIPGGIGFRMAAPDRPVFVMLGDGAYMMMPSELATAVQEGLSLVVVLIQNHGFSSVGALSRRLGAEGFGTRYRYRTASGDLDGATLPVDLAANAASFGARVVRVESREELDRALVEARDGEGTTVIHVETDPDVYVPRYQWWDVPIAEVSASDSTADARADYEIQRSKVRNYL